MKALLPRLLIFSLVICASFSAHSQGMALHWVKKIAPQAYPASAWEKSVVTSSNGDIYTLGHFFLTVDFDPGPGIHFETPAWDQGAFYLRKLDSSGVFQWVRVFECDDAFHGGRGLQVDTSGDLIVMLNFRDSVDMQPGPGESIHYDSSPDRGFVVAKFDTAGNYIWSRSVSGTQEVWTNELMVDNANHIYVSGYFNETVDFDPGPGTFSVTSLAPLPDPSGFVLKLDDGGDFEWVTTIVADNLSTSKFLDIGIGRYGDLYCMASLAGNAVLNTPFDTVSLAASGVTDTYFFKLDTAGHLKWQRTLVGANLGTGHSLAVDSASNMYAVGYLAATLDIDPGPGVHLLTNPGTSSNYVLKLDSAGTFLWGNMISSSNYCKAYDTDCDRDGNLYISVLFSGTCEAGFGSGSTSYTCAGLSDNFYTKLDPSGNYLWSQPISSPDRIYCYDIHADLFGNLYTTGQLFDTTSVGDGPFAQEQGVAGGISCFAKWGACAVSYGNSTVTACNQYLSPGGVSYTESGIYHDTLSYSGGCDSIITIDLTINTVNTGVSFNAGMLASMEVGATYQWLNCDSNHVEIAGATDSVFTPTISGNYAVRVENNGCIDTSSCYYVLVIGTLDGDLPDEIINFYPNPSNGEVTLNFESIQSLVEIELLDVSGKLVLSDQYMDTAQCNLRLDFAPGLYHLVVNHQKGRRTFSLVLL